MRREKMTSLLMVCELAVLTFILFCLVKQLTNAKKYIILLEMATNILRMGYKMFSGIDVGDLMDPENTNEKPEVPNENWE
jgi:hypothetical protein